MLIRSKHPMAQAFLMAILVYTMVSVFYFLPLINQCSTSLLRGPSDHTSGYIHLNTFDNSDPWLGKTKMTNYPFGEDMWQPMSITSQLTSIPYWVISKIAGPVCGFNILTWIGFIFSAIMMFGLLRWLTKRNDLALLGGYMAAFTPYLQIKTSAHIEYAFSGIFSLLIWTYFLIIQKPTVKRGIIFGLLFSSNFYLNGYFILISTILLIGLLTGTTIYHLYSPISNSRKQIATYIKVAGVSIITTILFLSPIVYIKFTHSEEIQKSLQTSRGDIKKEADILAARPIEYILPATTHPLFGKYTQRYTDGAQRGSNDTEFTLFVGWSSILLSLIFIVKLLGKRTKEVLYTTLDPKMMLTVLTTSIVITFVLSLPPGIMVFGHTITTPSGYLIQHIAYWRVFARLQMIIVHCLTILSIFGLGILINKLSIGKQRLLVATCFFVIFFEYLTFWPIRQIWSYDSVPEVYKRLEARSDVRSIVEYPLAEAPYIPTTLVLTYQNIHKKPMMNSYLSNSSDKNVRTAVSDLTHPESARILRALGIDLVLVHAKKPPVNLAEDFVLIDESIDINANNNVFVYEIRKGDIAKYALINGSEMEELDRIQSFPKMAYLVKDTGVFKIKKINGVSNNKSLLIKMTLDAKNSKTAIYFSQKGKTLFSGVVVNSEEISLEVDVNYPLEVTIENGSEVSISKITTRIP